MAQIKEFTADIQPNAQVPFGERRRREPELGIQQAGQTLLHATNVVAHTLSANEAYAENQDIQSGYKDASLFRQRAQQKLDEMKEGGKFDADTYGEWLTQAGDEYRQNRTTNGGLQRWDAHAANIYTEFGHQAVQVSAQQAGENAINDANARSQADGLSLQRDPTQLDAILKQNEDSVFDLPANVPIQAKQKILLHLNAQAAKNAGLGWIEVNPLAAKQKFDDSDQPLSRFITPEEREYLMDRADTKQRVIESQQIKAREDADRQWHISNQNIMNDALVSMEKGKDKNDQPFDAQSVEKLATQQDPKTGRPMLEPSQVNLLLNELRRQAKEGKATDDEDTLTKYAPRLYNNALGPEEITALRASGLLSNTTFERWLKYSQDGNTTLKTMHGQALKQAGVGYGVIPGAEWVASKEQQASYHQYDRWLHEQEEAAKADGKSATDIYLPGGAAEQGLNKFAPSGGVQTPEARIKQLVETKQPTQLSSGKWVVIDDLQGHWHPVAGPGGDAAAPNAAGTPGASLHNDPLFRAQQHSQEIKGEVAATRDDLNKELAATYNEYVKAKPGPIRDKLYKKYNDLFSKWQQLPTRVQSIEEDAQQNEREGNR